MLDILFNMFYVQLNKSFMYMNVIIEMGTFATKKY